MTGNHKAGDPMSSDQADREKSASLCEELEREPRAYRGKFVGVVRGSIVSVHEDFGEVVRRLVCVEPDRSQHFVALAGQTQPAEILNLGFS